MMMVIITDPIMIDLSKVLQMIYKIPNMYEVLCQWGPGFWDWEELGRSDPYQYSNSQFVSELKISRKTKPKRL